MKIKENIKIDIHCHILPGLDDGPSTLEESLVMLEEAERAGISQIVATPHLVWQERLLTKEEIKSLIEQLPNTLKIYSGAEVPLMEAPTLLEKGELITTGKMVLLDTPPLGNLLGLEQIIFKLVLKRITPVIAHPERNLSLAQNKRRMEHLKNMGAVFQINAGSLLGLLGKEVRKATEKLIEWGIADILASDAHNPEAYKIFKEATNFVEKKWGEEIKDKMTQINILPLLENLEEEARKVGQGK